METGGTPLLWIGFVGFVLAMPVIDRGVFPKQAQSLAISAGVLGSR